MYIRGVWTKNVYNSPLVATKPCYLYKSGVRRGIDFLARLIDCYNDLLLSCKRFVQEMCWTYTHLFLFLSNMILMQKCDYLILIVRKLWIRRRQSARVFSNNEKDRSWPSYTWPKSEGFDHLWKHFGELTGV